MRTGSVYSLFHPDFLPGDSTTTFLNDLKSHVDVNREIDYKCVFPSKLTLNTSLLFRIYPFKSLTPLSIAILCGNIQVVELLIEEGAQISNATSGRESTLDLAHYYANGLFPREIPVIEMKFEDNKRACCLTTEFTQLSEGDRKIYEFLRKKTMIYDGVGFGGQESDDIQPTPKVAFFAKSLHLFRYYLWLKFKRNDLRSTVSRFRWWMYSFCSADGIEKLTLAEVIAVRAVALMLFVLTVVYNLCIKASDLKAFRPHEIKHTWLLLFLLVVVVLAREFWGFHT